MNLKKPKFWDQKKPNTLAYLLLPVSILLRLIESLKISSKFIKHCIFQNVQSKLVQLKPGKVRFKFGHNGQVSEFTKKAQRSLYIAGVNQNWKIEKIDSEKFTKDLLIKKASGSKHYTMEFVYTGNQSYVTQ